MARARHAALAASLVLATGNCSRPGRSSALQFDRAELVIPMRDGTRLFAVTLTPRHASGPLPILLERTPFGAQQELPNSDLPPMYRELAADGYIFVVQDIRGRYRSGGTFVVNRPLADSGGVDESTDAYDTIDWLIHHLPDNNGKVGVLGSSYRGWLAAMAGIHPHPALKAISPQAPTGDTWLGDDFYHQGAFRETQGVAFAAYVDGNRNPSVPDNDQYDFYLHQQTLTAIAKASGVGALPFWQALAAHPTDDEYWQSRALQRIDTIASVPTLIVGGWWDPEDIFGPQALYQGMSKHDASGLVHIVLGPWWHNAWLGPRADSVGPMALDSNTATWFRAAVQRPWFAWYLHGIGDGHFAAATLFESGANRWRALEQWPPAEAKDRNIYLSANGVLRFDSAAATRSDDSGYLSYRSDPASPVPYLPHDRDGSGWQKWLMQDQQFLGARRDLATWTSAPLEHDVVIAGNVTAHLFASTSGTDADWVVKLIDLFPDSGNARGYRLMVNADIVRGRYWKGFDHAVAIPSNRIIPFDVDLHQQYYRFVTGHRMMVEVQSSWFPLYDRNPQQFIDNIFDARPSDFQSAEQRIWHTRAAPSHLTLQLLP
ncbi:MAG TPA: CocE/NonD family hydrolase [Gemmatimonadales bacterium]